MIYLASPFTSPDPDVEKRRYLITLRACVAIVATAHNPASKPWGALHVFSPVVHSYPIAKFAALPGHTEYWWEWNKAMLVHASQMWILTLPGWDESAGVMREREFAKDRGIRWYYANWGVEPVTNLGKLLGFDVTSNPCV